MAAISAAVAAPQTVMIPATAHAASSQPGVPTRLRRFGRGDEDARADHRADDDHRRVDRAQLAHQRAFPRYLARRFSGHGRATSSFCATNAFTSAIAWSIVSRRQSVSAESRAQASLLTRCAAASLGERALSPYLGKIAVMNEGSR